MSGDVTIPRKDARMAAQLLRNADWNRHTKPTADRLADLLETPLTLQERVADAAASYAATHDLQPGDKMDDWLPLAGVVLAVMREQVEFMLNVYDAPHVPEFQRAHDGVTRAVLALFDADVTP